MILTGAQIAAEVAAGSIVIEGFDPDRIEPNSYGFRLAGDLLTHGPEVIDCARPPAMRRDTIGPDGYVLRPGRFYLGSTLEAMGGIRHAATLYANRSVSTLGLWIQFSAPLGHSGAVFPWTLELAVAQPLRVYAGMRVGKIAFWVPAGPVSTYTGRYQGSPGAVASRFSLDPTPAEVTRR